MTEEPETQISFRLPASLKQDFDTFCKENGWSKNNLLRELVKRILTDPSILGLIPDSSSNVQKELEGIQESADRHHQVLLEQMSKIASRLDALERTQLEEKDQNKAEIILTDLLNYQHVGSLDTFDKIETYLLSIHPDWQEEIQQHKIHFKALEQLKDIGKLEENLRSHKLTWRL